MINLIAYGGDSQHFPDHSLDGCIAAYVNGSNSLLISVFFTTDNVCVVSPSDDLSEISNINVLISESSWLDITDVDIGDKFSPGNDKPWKQVREPYERVPERGRLKAPLINLSKLLHHLPVGMNIIFDLHEDQRLDEHVKNIIEEVNKSDINSAEILLPNLDSLSRIIKVFPNINCIVFGLTNKENKKLSVLLEDDRLELAKSIFTSLDSVDVNVNKSRIYALCNSIDDLEVAIEDDRISGSVTSSVLEAFDLIYGRRNIFTELFSGNSLDSNNWISGISSGFEMPTRMLWKKESDERLAKDTRKNFDTKLTVNNGLVFDIKEGDQYASAGVISKFPVRNDFFCELDWKYQNPTRATMMLLGITNTDVFRSHQPEYDNEGGVENPRWRDEHQIFDTHGNPPFVSMEHEENDGTRIICNRVDTGFYRWFNNFYNPNVGDGRTTEGSFRLMRRNSYYCSYYKDEHNPNWVGVGYVENESMNNSVYMRLGAKHYPKSGVKYPLPSNYVVFNNLKIYKRTK
ncbi:MAG: hypothetical protein DHS20C13_08760 [Thermodesulfobacteriota bacterium]|nr:MAG: hypothetical protein DHS20C13_08760 [Thermodesulfobacteriota bacterium]